METLDVEHAKDSEEKTTEARGEEAHLASCDLFVGKFTSSLFRLSYELHAAECDCAAPFISSAPV